MTYHGPGQLVLYPVLDLRAYEQDLHWYLRALEETVIRTLASLGVTAAREEGLTGVWVGDSKVCAIGVRVSRWITMHGLALNVCPDLSHFEHIVPCGIADRSVTSTAQLLPGEAGASELATVQELLLFHFAEVFNVRYEDPPAPL